MEEHGNQRLAYLFPDNREQGSDIILDSVPIESLLLCLVLVPDMHDITLQYGVQHRISDIPDDPKERRLIRFLCSRVPVQ